MYFSNKIAFIFINLSISYQCFAADTIPVFQFQTNGSFSDQTYLIRSGKLGKGNYDIKELTVCVRVKILHLRGRRSYFLSFGNINSPDVLTGFIERNHHDRFELDEPYK